ncbi:hypothetical protein [Nonomuraea sp. LPB2021202275-12-8]|uniref:hypothetical protein n=1 Tax=Nonomuraea sp. LPB2021202275-12-8 TaxID=3120159 RepID=UPI00300D1A6D
MPELKRYQQTSAAENQNQDGLRLVLDEMARLRVRLDEIAEAGRRVGHGDDLHHARNGHRRRLYSSG